LKWTNDSVSKLDRGWSQLMGSSLWQGSIRWRLW